MNKTVTLCLWLGFCFTILTNPTQVFSKEYSTKSKYLKQRNNKAYIELPISKNEVRPRYLQTLADSMTITAKKFHAFQTATLHLNTPGFRTFEVDAIRINNRLVPIKYWHFRKARPQRTGKSTDVYLSGNNNFFTIEYNDKSIAYTTDGRFALDRNGYLITKAHDRPVLGESGKIQVPGEEMIINHKGEIFYENEYIDKLRITSFENMSGLGGYEGTMFFILDKDNIKIIETTRYSVQQAFLEMNNQFFFGNEQTSMLTPLYQLVGKGIKEMFKNYPKFFKAVGP